MGIIQVESINRKLSVLYEIIFVFSICIHHNNYTFANKITSIIAMVLEIKYVHLVRFAHHKLNLNLNLNP